MTEDIERRPVITVLRVSESGTIFVTDDSAGTSEDTPVDIPVLDNDSPLISPVLISSVSKPSNGTTALNPDGSIAYAPARDFFGTDSFTYTVTLANGTQLTATVTVVVDPENDPPVAIADAKTTTEDTPVIIDVLANDSDDGGAVTLVEVGAASSGTVEITSDGKIRYVPAPDFSGEDSFSYTIRDAEGETATTTVVVTVTPANDPPDAVDDTATVVEDGSVAIDVLANDSDADGDALRVVSVTQGAAGAVSINADGTVQYVPAGDFAGQDSFTYTVTDDAGEDASATVTVTVTGENDPPVAVADTATTAEDTAVAIDVLANDRDPEDGAPVLVSVSDPANGRVEITPAGTVRYTPDADFFGADGFSYTVRDSAGAVSGASVAVTVEARNDAPVARDDAGTTREDLALTIAVLGNDTDADGDALRVTAASDGANGRVTINADNTVTYTPAPDFSGADSFTYTVTDAAGVSRSAVVRVTVNPENDPPIAVDDSATTDEDTAVSIDLLANDRDPDGDGLAIAGLGTPAHGRVEVSGDGIVTYTPDADFSGADSFAYTVSDGAGGLDTATVTVVVRAVNDAPEANDDALSVAEDVPATFDALANDTDPDGDPLRIVSVTGAANGRVAIGPDGRLTYTPDTDFTGEDSFGYTVSDGRGGTDTATVTVSVGGENDPPVATPDNATTAEDSPVSIPVLANDTDPDGDPLAVASVTRPANGSVAITADGTLTYAPDADFFGEDGFSYTVSDPGGATASAAVTVLVTGVNDPPVAVPDSAATAEDVAVAIDVLANDDDVDGDTLSVMSVSDAPNGTVSIEPDGSLLYTPDPEFAGTDSFGYTVSDGAGGTATGTVTVTVGAVEDGPVAVDDSADTDEDTAVVIAVLANDDDPDGDGVAVATVMDGRNGRVTLNGDGTVTYTPDPDFAGTDSFDYTLAGGGAAATATVTVTVAEVNDAPVAADDAATTAEDTPLVIDVRPNDGDADGDPLAVVALGIPAHGQVAVNPDGSLTYAPDPDFFGADAFSYTVSDGRGGSATATVSIGVEARPDAPVAATDFASLRNTDAVLLGHVLDNDSDADGDAFALVGIGGDPATLGVPVGVGAGASIVLAADGSYLLVLGDGYRDLGLRETALIEVPYTIRDATGLEGDGVLAITVVGPGFDDNLVAGDSLIAPIPGNEGVDETFGGSDNVIGGGLGDDLIAGGTGNDTLEGNGGRDSLYGEDGDDLLRGNGNDDRLDGGTGNDTLDGGDGVDLLLGGTGSDLLRGGQDNDKLFGNGGNDTLDGGAGNDALMGEAGADRLVGGAGNDVLFGGDGADVLIGSAGDDGMVGGAGPDRFEFAPGEGRDTIVDFTPGEDTIVLRGFRPEFDASAAAGALAIMDGRLTLATGEGTVLVFEGLAPGEITEDDFLIG